MKEISAMRRNGYTNGVLTVIAVLLALNLVDRHADAPGVLGTSAAVAAGPETDPGGDGPGLISAAEQRKIMIVELRRLASKMDRLESKLSSGISVKVTEMPAAPKGAEGGESK